MSDERGDVRYRLAFLFQDRRGMRAPDCFYPSTRYCIWGWRSDRAELGFIRVRIEAERRLLRPRAICRRPGESVLYGGCEGKGVNAPLS